MTAGLAIVLTHNVWVASWPVLITLFGWLTTIGGAVRIAFPDQVRTMGDAMLRKPMAMTIGGAIWLVVGARPLLLRLFPLTLVPRTLHDPLEREQAQK